MLLPEALSRLIAEFRNLPAVGLKTATRYAYKIIDMSEDELESFIDALKSAKEKIHFCAKCGNYSETDICERCETADQTIICVVKEPKDIVAFEKTGAFDGLYHVLHGTLDFQKGIGAENIRIKELLSRLVNVKEVIVATNSDISGEMTAVYLANIIKALDIKVTRLAHGLPMGSEIEYADEVTLSKALLDRKEM